MKKLSLLFIIFFLALTSSLSLIAQTATLPSGDGSESNPYQIATLDNLYWLSQTISVWDGDEDIYFIQTANIDASTSSSWDGGAGFTPIGNGDDSFYGFYDGNEYYISDIYINRPSTEYVGLFGYAKDGEIKNLGVINLTITGGDYVGGLVGETWDSDITKCYTTGSVTGGITDTGDEYAGGLIGVADNITTKCYSKCSVSGRTAGGLVGHLESLGLLEYSYITGSVSATYCAGGLVGFDSDSETENCYSKGSVSGGDIAGGFVGLKSVNDITNCYSMGSVSGGDNLHTGGFVGILSAMPPIYAWTNINDSYFDSQNSGQSVAYGTNQFSACGVTAYTTDAMKVQSNYAAEWDFVNIWAITPEVNNGYPYLQWQIIPNGDGSEANPYQIATLDNLYWLSTTSAVWDKNFIQTANIDASATSTWNDGGGMWPIGNTADASFTGNYDGDGNTISSLTCTQPSWGNVGLFGIVDGSEIKDLDLSGLSIEGSAWTGGLVGKAFNATIRNIVVSGTVTAGSSNIGGLIGLAEECTISGCNSSVVVTGGSNTGGLIGYSNANDISTSNCNATSVSGTWSYTGGFIGDNENSQVTNCYSIANIVGEGDYVGGFIGNNYESIAGSATISDCYCTATFVTAEGWSIGGFIGQNDGCEVVNCYSTANVTSNASLSGSGAGGNVGGFIGYNLGASAEVSTCYATGNVVATVKSTSDDKDIGGFIGEAGGLIENCYSRGSVSTNGDGTPEIGVFIGKSIAEANIQYCYTTGDYTTTVGDYGFIYTNSGTATNNFYNSDLSSQNSGTGAIGKTTAEMKQFTTFLEDGWNFTLSGTSWAMNGIDNNGYPFLRFQDYAPAYLFLGNSSDWSTTSNWSEGSLPTSSVIIPDVTNDPIIAFNGTANCNNLKLETGATLTIESNASGTGSLIINGTLKNNGTITSERYFPSASSLNWHVISAPVASMGIANSGFAPTTGDFYAWDEANPGTWVNYKNTTVAPTFNTVNGGDNFVSAKGYLLAFAESSPMHMFSGSLSAGNQTFMLKNSTGKDWTYNSGWNLMGNPYSSAIDWYMADKTLFEDDFVYAYNPQANEGAGAYVPIDGSIENAYIAANQGFFVVVKSSTVNNSVFTFTNAMQTHGGTYFKNTTENDKLVLRFSGEMYYDETTIRQCNESTYNKDRVDAFKMNSFNINASNIYSISDDNIKLSINSIPKISTEHNIRIGIVAPINGLYKIEVVEASNYMMDNNIYLEDLLLNKWHKISESEYGFTTEAGDIADRFVIHFGVVGIEEITPSNDLVQLWTNNSTINLFNHENISGEINVYNIMGQVVMQTKLNTNTNQQIDLFVPDGYYIVNIISSKQIVNKKVFLR